MVRADLVGWEEAEEDRRELAEGRTKGVWVLETSWDICAEGARRWEQGLESDLLGSDYLPYG